MDDRLRNYNFGMLECGNESTSFDNITVVNDDGEYTIYFGDCSGDEWECNVPLVDVKHVVEQHLDTCHNSIRDRYTTIPAEPDWTLDVYFAITDRISVTKKNTGNYSIIDHARSSCCSHHDVHVTDTWEDAYCFAVGFAEDVSRFSV